MRRSTTWLLAAAAGTLFAFAVVADQALWSQVRRARETAVDESREMARLTALSIRAALAQIEERVLAGEPVPEVAAARLANPPRVSIPGPSAVPYARRTRAQLATLLSSTGTSPSGLPEAVLARLALGTEAVVSAPGEPPPDVAERLLTGRLPVRPEDLPALARALGVHADARVPALQERLLRAPDVSELPAAPAFRRIREGASVVGWTAGRDERIRYAAPVAPLLRSAPHANPERIAAEASPNSVAADVPDVEGLSIHVQVPEGEVRRLRVLRVALWIAVATSTLGLIAVRRALAAESQATRREKAFLASVTHELRTPLTAIRLFGETLAAGRGNPVEYGALVAEESQRLEDLVERVLAATRAGERPRFAPLDPGEVVRSALALIAPRAERRAVTLRDRTERALPMASWDAEAVRGALLNLLDNAVKHGREGGRVDVRAESDGAFVRLSVVDDGPGIARRERKGLFQRFVRGSTDAPGAGLGLHLVEQVARAHGGHVDLTSEEGRGCVFTLRLPVEPPALRAGNLRADA